jgi:hypothetical protein
MLRRLRHPALVAGAQPLASLCALRLFHASGLSATTVLCVRKGNQARPGRRSCVRT